MIGICVLQFGHAEIFPGCFDQSFLDLLVNFPQLDVTIIGGKDLLITSLSSEPAKASNGFLNLHASEWVELLGVRLKLHKVL